LRITMAVQNLSALVSDEEVEAALRAFEHQVERDFAPLWRVQARLHRIEKDVKPPAGMWSAVIVDDPGAALLGEHDDAGSDVPELVVAAGADRKVGIEWTVTFSHELLECLADPWLNSCAQADEETFYALEVCDPVQGDPLAYRIDGIWVSDFVTPAWFVPGPARRSGVRYDFQGHLSGPFEIAEYGYACVHLPGKGWLQRQVQDGKPVDSALDAEPAGPAKLRPRPSQLVRRQQAAARASGKRP
jgi:hypothetical protein